MERIRPGVVQAVQGYWAVSNQAVPKGSDCTSRAVLRGRATLIVARAHILSRPRVMCSQVRML